MSLLRCKRASSGGCSLLTAQESPSPAFLLPFSAVPLAYSVFFIWKLQTWRHQGQPLVRGKTQIHYGNGSRMRSHRFSSNTSPCKVSKQVHAASPPLGHNQQDTKPGLTCSTTALAIGYQKELNTSVAQPGKLVPTSLTTWTSEEVASSLK